MFLVELRDRLLANRLTSLLVVVVALLVVGSGLLLQNFIVKSIPLEEIELQFDPEGPYALLIPRRDGNAINLNVRRVASYESFSYELVYQAEGIDRGAGDPKTFIDLKNKSEFNQEILFGTCSQGFTADPAHCVFDKGVENGTLTLRFKKSNKLFKMLIAWHLQKPDVALGKITSADEHFIYTTQALREELVLTGFTMVTELTAVPKLPTDKQVVGKVYALNIPPAKTLPKGEALMELSDDPPAGAQLARWDEAKNSWEMLEIRVDGSKLSTSASGAGVFAVLANVKNP